MKVFYVGNRYQGCYYVRCLQQIVNAGWDGTTTSLRQEPVDRATEFQACMDADVIVFQRPADDARAQVFELFAKAKEKYKAGDQSVRHLAEKLIVFENDDTYKKTGVPEQMFTGQDVSPQEILKTVNENLDRCIKAADLVTTTTEYLASEYRELNDNVEVLPNCIDPDDWDEPLPNETDKVRIGIIGSVANTGDYEHIFDVFQELAKDERVQLVLFSLPADHKDLQLAREIYKKEIADWEKLNPEWHYFVPMADYFDTLRELRLDLTVIPRRDNYFNRCKSNLKFLEASMLKVPVIAQGFSTGDSPYQGKDEEFMRICIENSEWLPAIQELIENKKLREELGQKAYDYVISNYNIHDKITLWENVYEKNLDKIRQN